MGEVGFLYFKLIKIKVDRYICTNSSEEFRHTYVVYSTLYFLPQLALDLRRIGKHVINASKFGYKFSGSLWTNTRTTREVVGRVTHKCKKVDNLRSRGEIIFLAYFRWSHGFVSATMSGTEHKDIVGY